MPVIQYRFIHERAWHDLEFEGTRVDVTQLKVQIAKNSGLVKESTRRLTIRLSDAQTGKELTGSEGGETVAVGSRVIAQLVPLHQAEVIKHTAKTHLTASELQPAENESNRKPPLPAPYICDICCYVLERPVQLRCSGKCDGKTVCRAHVEEYLTHNPNRPNRLSVCPLDGGNARTRTPYAIPNKRVAGMLKDTNLDAFEYPKRPAPDTADRQRAGGGPAGPDATAASSQPAQASEHDTLASPEDGLPRAPSHACFIYMMTIDEIKSVLANNVMFVPQESPINTAFERSEAHNSSGGFSEEDAVSCIPLAEGRTSYVTPGVCHPTGIVTDGENGSQLLGGEKGSLVEMKTEWCKRRYGENFQSAATPLVLNVTWSRRFDSLAVLPCKFQPLYQYLTARSVGPISLGSVIALDTSQKAALVDKIVDKMCDYSHVPNAKTVSHDFTNSSTGGPPHTSCNQAGSGLPQHSVRREPLQYNVHNVVVPNSPCPTSPTANWGSRRPNCTSVAPNATTNRSLMLNHSNSFPTNCVTQSSSFSETLPPSAPPVGSMEVVLSYNPFIEYIGYIPKLSVRSFHRFRDSQSNAKRRLVEGMLNGGGTASTASSRGRRVGAGEAGAASGSERDKSRRKRRRKEKSKKRKREKSERHRHRRSKRRHSRGEEAETSIAQAEGDDTPSVSAPILSEKVSPSSVSSTHNEGGNGVEVVINSPVGGVEVEDEVEDEDEDEPPVVSTASILLAVDGEIVMNDMMV